jgi:hypothetical protein
MKPAFDFLFNFSASYSGGGYKRLYEYARWFNDHGGASFIVHPRCADLARTFERNRVFVPSQSRLSRLFNDCSYLAEIERAAGEPELYYSYGIPLYRRFGTVSWFHLSNVLPLGARGIPLQMRVRTSLAILGRRIRRGLANADVISAESGSSTSLIPVADPARLFVSVNGSDDEIAALREEHAGKREEFATVVGTIRYKALEDSARVFQVLKQTHPDLQLEIIGNEAWIPQTVRSIPGAIVRGQLDRPAVIDRLRRARFYITTSLVENSYNAASEGIFLADESYISDIGPHRELLAGERCERILLGGMPRPLIHVQRRQLRGLNLKSWDTVIVEMIARARQVRRS